MLSLLMGWPAVVLSTLVVAVGLASRRPSVVIAGAIIGLPFFAYLAATPRFRGFALLPVVLQVIAAAFLARKQPVVAAGLCTPAVLFAAYVLAIV